MELWIRSQNKADLLKVEMLGKTDGVITAYYTCGKCELGEYKTEERAIEVLDEIQEILETRIISQMVYEMPKE